MFTDSISSSPLQPILDALLRLLSVSALRPERPLEMPLELLPLKGDMRLLFSADSVRELTDELDAILPLSSDWAQNNIESLGEVLEHAEEIKSRRFADTAMAKTLGAGPVMRLDEDPVPRALFEYPDFLRHVVNPDTDEPRPEPMSLLYDIGIPEKIRDLFWEVFRSDAAMLTLLIATFEGRVLDPWKALALVDFVRKGNLARAILLASIYESPIPYSLVPREQRLNLGKLERETRQRVAEWRRKRADSLS